MIAAVFTPQRSALASVASDDWRFALAPVEPIVEPQFDHLDVLINAEGSGEDLRRNCAGAGAQRKLTACNCAAVQRDVSTAEAQEVVLNLGRPVAEQAKFEADARHPAPAVLV